MAVDDNQNVVVNKYNRSQIPIFEEGLGIYLQNELQRIERAIEQLTNASIQVTDQAPTKPIKGLVRYAISPWNPLGNGFSGLVVYNGSAWVAV
tara:strand:- start:502 stop:780 length:279 start_codon:yes stop_codon:yes gene_type:complete